MNFIDVLMILVLIMMLLQFMIYMRHSQVFTEKEWYQIMFEVVEKTFVVAISFSSCNELQCVSMNNQECKIRPEVINISSNEH